MKPALVILAAGASRRLGTCKALAPLGPGPEHTPLGRLLEAGRSLDEVAPLVVTGAHREAIAAAAPAGVELLPNPRWEEGRTGGVVLAAAARPGRDLLIAPVDVPLVPPAVFEGLARAWAAAGAPPRGWLAPAPVPGPVTDATPVPPAAPRGHPVVVGRELLAELALGPPDRPLRALRASADPLWTLPVASGAVLEHLKTPADLAALQSRIQVD